MNAAAVAPGFGPQPFDAPVTRLSTELEPAACCGIGLPHSAPMHAQQHVFRAGDALGDFYIVRSGSYKCYWLDRRGQEYVTGFRFPGELLGANAVFACHHPNSAVALETSTVWIVSYAELRRLMATNDGLRIEFFRLISREIADAAVLSCDYTAEERVARFLLELSRRFARRGYSATRFHLSMSRRDIANHLRLATETVTRVLTHFQEQGLINVDRRLVSLLNGAQLRQLCASTEGTADGVDISDDDTFPVLPAGGRPVSARAGARIS